MDLIRPLALLALGGLAFAGCLTPDGGPPAASPEEEISPRPDPAAGASAGAQAREETNPPEPAPSSPGPPPAPEESSPSAGDPDPETSAGPRGNATHGSPGGNAPESAPEEPPVRALVRVETVLDAGLRMPVGVASARDGSGRLFVVEQHGLVRVLRDGRLLEAPFLDVRNRTEGDAERGLLGLAFHPEFSSNGLVYVYYTSPSNDTKARRNDTSLLVRYRVADGNPDRLDPGSAHVVLSVWQPWSEHKAGQLAFGPDGYLYVGLGDGGFFSDPDLRAQNASDVLGKILRIEVDGRDGYRIPPGNPFADGSGRPEVWALGLRNPWRFSFDRGTGDLWIGDVGQGSREEVNRAPAGEAGLNFGWSRFEGSIPFRPNATGDGLTFPVTEYNHTVGCAVIGGAVYRGAAIPALRGTYVFGDHCTGILFGVTRAAEGWTRSELARTDAHLTAFGEDEAGEIHFSDYKGRLFRLAKPEDG